FRTISTRRPLTLIRQCSVLMLIFHQLQNLFRQLTGRFAVFPSIAGRFVATYAAAVTRPNKFVGFDAVFDRKPDLSNFECVAAPIVLLTRDDGSIDRKRECLVLAEIVVQRPLGRR